MAYVLSSVSGNLISAASAGFAPTNSADVSAIASSYQVVSATATQLYAGTAYVTSVNDNPISASRAGNAANASMANSAYYDGTGRLISALPDSATVSAIASSYAESAASSKQDTLTFGYDAEDKISGINGSAIAGGEGGGTTYVSPSGTVWISGSSIEGTDSAYIPESAQQNYTADYISVGPILKWINEICTSLKVSGGYWNAPINVFDSLDTLVTSLPVDVGALYTISGGTPPYKVSSEEWSTMDYSAYGDPTIIPAKLIKLAHASASSNYYTTANVSGFFNSASVSFNADNQISAIGGSALAGGGIKVSPSGTLWISGESAESTDSAFIPGVATETFVQSGGSFQIGTTQPLTVAGANKVTIQNGSWFDGTIYVSGNGTLVSSVAHAGADWPQTFSAEAPITIGANGWFDVTSYSAFNVVTSPDQVVQLAHASAVSGYALSSDVSATVDIVSTQSANWGGSALALSAGPGISLTLSGNTLVASTDETVLWSNDNGAATFTASEVVTNFERIAVYVTDNPLSESIQRVEIPMMGGNLTAPKFSLVSQWDSSWRVLMWWVKLTSSDMKSFSISSAGFAGALTNSSWSNGNEPNYFRFYKVVGINRRSGA